jgi:hypothetical protein
VGSNLQQIMTILGGELSKLPANAAALHAYSQLQQALSLTGVQQLNSLGGLGGVNSLGALSDMAGASSGPPSKRHKQAPRDMRREFESVQQAFDHWSDHSTYYDFLKREGREIGKANSDWNSAYSSLIQLIDKSWIPGVGQQAELHIKAWQGLAKHFELTVGDLCKVAKIILSLQNQIDCVQRSHVSLDEGVDKKPLGKGTLTLGAFLKECQLDAENFVQRARLAKMNK